MHTILGDTLRKRSRRLGLPYAVAFLSNSAFVFPSLPLFLSALPFPPCSPTLLLFFTSWKARYTLSITVLCIFSFRSSLWLFFPVIFIFFFCNLVYLGPTLSLSHPPMPLCSPVPRPLFAPCCPRFQFSQSLPRP